MARVRSDWVPWGQAEEAGIDDVKAMGELGVCLEYDTAVRVSLRRAASYSQYAAAVSN